MLNLIIVGYILDPQICHFNILSAKGYRWSKLGYWGCRHFWVYSWENSMFSVHAESEGTEVSKSFCFMWVGPADIAHKPRPKTCIKMKTMLNHYPQFLPSISMTSRVCSLLHSTPIANPKNEHVHSPAKHVWLVSQCYYQGLLRTEHLFLGTWRLKHGTINGENSQDDCASRAFIMLLCW